MESKPGDDNRVFGLLKKIFPGFRLGGAAPDADNSQFWPILIERSMREWRDLVDEAEVNRMLKNFDPENSGF